MPKFEDFTFESSTGKNLLHARKCIPDGKPRAVVQIEHGVADHISRYDDLMEYLASNGIVCVGDDHLGHGESIRSPEEQGFFAEEGLDVTIVQPAEDTAEALLGTGQAQFGISYQDYIANSYAGGNTGLVAVAAVIQHNTSGIMSPKELGVTSAKGMEGLRYATW
jgi:hypothetical protein